ncbi:MAG: hypothetical protein LBC63_05260 [Holophagales bacterium]|nr:hypothetical protein [Holophagales bacterium]
MGTYTRVLHEFVAVPMGRGGVFARKDRPTHPSLPLTRIAYGYHEKIAEIRAKANAKADNGR